MVARDIPKLLLNTKCNMVLIDGDTVEEKNMIRQSYQKHDIGENKAIALSRKINTFYGDICEAYDGYLTKDEITAMLEKRYINYTPVIIGCVDNDITRKLLESTYEKLPSCIYIDSANSKYDGDIYVSVKDNGRKAGAIRSEVYKLEEDIHPADISCEAQVSMGNTQFFTTNLKMATEIIEHISAVMHKQIKVGVTVVHRFETIHIDAKV